MKINKINCSLLAMALLIICSAISCGKSQEEDPYAYLPKETQTGAGTFGCFVNGKLLIPRGISGLNAGRSLDGKDIYIGVIDLNATRGRQAITINLVKSATDEFTITCVAYQQETFDSQIKICPPTNYQLNITRYDNKNRILSGNFTIKIAASATNPELNITDGRFDVSFSN